MPTSPPSREDARLRRTKGDRGILFFALYTALCAYLYIIGSKHIRCKYDTEFPLLFLLRMVQYKTGFI